MISRRRKVVLSWLLVGVAAATMLVFGVVDGRDDRTNAERAHDIGATIACPQCVGQSVVESDVAIAREIRVEIGPTGGGRVQRRRHPSPVRRAIRGLGGSDAV